MTTGPVPPGGRDTPYGRLYPPVAQGWQILLVVCAFLGSIGIGAGVGRVPGDLGETARTLLHVPFVAVFLLGYAAWSARVAALGASLAGRSVLKSVFTALVRRKRPDSLEQILPSQDRLIEFAVRAQRAGGSFSWVGWPVGILAGLAALALDTAMGVAARVALVGGSVVAWGYVLALLGRRGWLPIMEPE